jgi:hypothetical protein
MCPPYVYPSNAIASGAIYCLMGFWLINTSTELNINEFAWGGMSGLSAQAFVNVFARLPRGRANCLAAGIASTRRH